MTFEQNRLRMVDDNIAPRGIVDPLVLSAMRAVHREQFVPAVERSMAYRDGPLPIGFGQTISQPYIVALMTEALQLRGGESVLEIGTGSGYAAAILAEIADEVVTIERVSGLAERARKVLKELAYDNVTVITGDGTKGHPDLAPYDAIVVTAGGPKVPQPLCDQLKIGGRLVIPVGPAETFQTLIRVTRVGSDDFRQENLCEVRFVPLIGQEGWHHTVHDAWSDPDLAPRK